MQKGNEKVWSFSSCMITKPGSGSAWSCMQNPDSHWNQCGSRTLENKKVGFLGCFKYRENMKAGPDPWLLTKLAGDGEQNPGGAGEEVPSADGNPRQPSQTWQQVGLLRSQVRYPLKSPWSLFHFFDCIQYPGPQVFYWGSFCHSVSRFLRWPISFFIAVSWILIRIRNGDYS